MTASNQTALPLGVVGAVELGAEPGPKVEPMFKRPDYFNLYAIKRGVPEGWEWKELKALGDMPEKDRARQYSQMTGYVHNGARFATGKRAGQLKPRSPVPGTERTIIFSMAEFDAFLREWELETGKCHHCDGTGQAWDGWNAEKGNSYRDCTHCFKTGKAHP